MSERRRDLIVAAIKALENGSVPLSEWFIHEHAVSLDECVTLADDIAAALHLHLYAGVAS